MASHIVRKNFSMLDEIVKKLEFLAKTTQKKQSQIIQELIIKESQKYENIEKLKRLEKMQGKFDGLLGEVSLQNLKSEHE